MATAVSSSACKVPRRRSGLSVLLWIGGGSVFLVVGVLMLLPAT